MILDAEEPKVYYTGKRTMEKIETQRNVKQKLSHKIKT